MSPRIGPGRGTRAHTGELKTKGCDMDTHDVIGLAFGALLGLVFVTLFFMHVLKD